jgi:DNA polymerase elongation subunit (family B)
LRFYTNVKLIGNYIFCRGYENGLEIKEKIKYEPTLYVPSNKKTEYLTLDNKYVSPIKPGTISDTRNFIEKYKDVDGFDYYGNSNALYQYISDSYPEEVIDFDINQIKLYVLDIETTAEQGTIDAQAAREEIILITIQDYASKNILTWGTRSFTEQIENHTYIECENEAELLLSFLDFWENNYPDVVTGWNCSGFDIPYIINRIAKNFGEKEATRLSIWKKLSTREFTSNGRDEIEYQIYGITVLDYLQLFKKFAFISVENYRLNTVAEEVLKENKLDHNEYETFKDFYTQNFSLFVKYNIQDCILITKFEKKLCLIKLAFTLAYQAKVNPEDVYYQGRMWDGIIYNYLRRQGIVIPSKKEVIEKTEKFKGAHVKDPQVGKFKYVCSLDLASLYPSLIRTYNISPETLVNERNNYASIENIINDGFEIKPEHSKYTICPNGSMYRKEKQGFLPTIMEKMFNERTVYKKKMLQAQSSYEQNPSEELEEEISMYKIYQHALKICLNSAFGSLGNEYFRFYDIRNAEAITYSGQAVIKWIENKLNLYLNNVAGTKNVDMILGADTDSVFLHFNPIVEKIFKDKHPEEVEVINFLTRICDGVLQKFIDKSFDELCNLTNAYENCLHMKREKICSSALWRKKKNYILNVWDNEGVRYSEPKIKMSGIEAVKTSTPAFCRVAIKNAIDIIMNGEENELIDFVKKTKNEFFKLSPEEISTPKGITDMDKFYSASTIYRKSTPMHSRGALLYNYHLKRLKLTHKYPLISNGEKIKVCYLKLPNPIRENVISYSRILPPELGIHKYIDYETQFDKTFMSPIISLLDIIGWRTEKRVNLANFYV